MTLSERHAQVESYLGKTVNIEIDRPIGYVHKKNGKTLVYPINYGYIPGVLGGDDEELDVYVLGLDVPVSECEVRIIAIVHRSDDVEDKLVGAVGDAHYTAHDIESAVHFQEQFHESEIEVAE